MASLCAQFLLHPVWADFAPIGEIDVRSGPPAEAPSTKPDDRSTLWIAAQTRVTVVVTDQKGRRTGYDSKKLKELQEIPNSSLDLDFVPNKYTGEEHSEAFQRMSISPAPKGLYTIQAFGLQDGPFQIDISALSRDGSSEPSKQVEGLINAKEIKTFSLNFDPAPNARIAVIEKSR